MRLAPWAFCAGSLLLAGCSPIPIATTYPVTVQQRMASVEHWQVLADDVAAGIAQNLPGGRPYLYIAPQPGGGEFGRAFEGYLTTYLMHQGYTVFDAPRPDALTVNYGVERVRHREAPDRRPPPGFFTLIGSGIWLGHQAATHWGDGAGSAFVAAVPAGIALDLISMAFTPPTHTEIIVTVAIASSAQQYVFRENRNYYVNDRDWREYPNAPLVVAGTRPATAAAMVRVVGD